MRHIIILASCLTLIAAAALGGCAAGPSAWELNLTTGPDTATPLAAESPVRVRNITWERMEQTLSTEQVGATATDTHPEEWTPERRAEAKTQLLRGLQLSEPPASVRIVGRSEFRTTDKMSTDSVTFHNLARKLGADTVIWTSKVVGKADKVVQEPVTTIGSGSGSGRSFEVGGGGRSGSFADNRTTYVPVVIKADEIAFSVYFLRITP